MPLVRPAETVVSGFSQPLHQNLLCSTSKYSTEHRTPKTFRDQQLPAPRMDDRLDKELKTAKKVHAWNNEKNLAGLACHHIDQEYHQSHQAGTSCLRKFPSGIAIIMRCVRNCLGDEGLQASLVEFRRVDGAAYLEMKGLQETTSFYSISKRICLCPHVVFPR